MMRSTCGSDTDAETRVMRRSQPGERELRRIASAVNLDFHGLYRCCFLAVGPVSAQKGGEEQEPERQEAHFTSPAPGPGH